MKSSSEDVATDLNDARIYSCRCETYSVFVGGGLVWFGWDMGWGGSQRCEEAGGRERSW